MNYEFSEDYEPNVKEVVYCECGVAVQVENLRKHRATKSHKLTMMGQLHIAQKGGTNGLWACVCGEYVTFTQRKSHANGKRHQSRLKLIGMGCEVC
jgi:hypothetical protein